MTELSRLARQGTREKRKKRKEDLDGGDTSFFFFLSRSTNSRSLGHAVVLHRVYDRAIVSDRVSPVVKVGWKGGEAHTFVNTDAGLELGDRDCKTIERFSETVC